MPLTDMDKRRFEAASAVLDEHGKALAPEILTTIFKHAFPELFSDPPQAWLAPWEATLEMHRRAEGYYSKAIAYREMRDAHIKSQGGE